MKTALLYWVPHVLLLFFMMGSSVYYFIDLPSAVKAFGDLGFPAYTVYFNAIAKILGSIAIIVPAVPRVLKEWAYAGYLYILLMATQAVWMTMPGVPWPMFGFIAIWAFAYWRFSLTTPKHTM